MNERDELGEGPVELSEYAVGERSGLLGIALEVFLHARVKERRRRQC